MSVFDGISNETLSGNLAAIKDMPGMDPMVDAINAELKYRADNAAELAARAELVIICRSASETLAKIRHSDIAAISDPNGTIVKNARLTLVKLLMTTFDVSVHKAEKMVMVLSDESGQTDAAGDVEKAAAYVAAHPTSTVYSAVRPDDANKGAASDDSKTSK